MIFGEHTPEDTGTATISHCAESCRPHTITAPAVAQSRRRASSEASDLHDLHSPFNRRDYGDEGTAEPA